MKDYISIGKITNFHGIKGEARVGYSNFAQLKGAKTVYLLDNTEKITLEIEKVREGKNFAIVKFKDIDDINDLIKFKGQKLYVSKKEALNHLENDEYLINDLIGCKVLNSKGEHIGTIVNISTNGAQDLLNIENLLHQVKLVPFVNEFFPSVDIKNKIVYIKPIEGLL
ncbi:MAG: 16S rRNA processing protein RimM [Candidatus Gastranaerophilales bacterium]|nr:16S rRNA processing protein RimM [Candidatus Gastranaerophilales bacterium]